MKLPKPKYYTEKYNLKPHEFRSKIEILRLSGDTDVDNIPSRKNWTVLATEMANINTTTVDETSDSKGRINIHRARVIIRFPMSYSPTEKDTVRFNGEIYNISAITDLQECHVYLELTCERVR